ncbi:hypothetical protein ACLOJK_028234, partial [Asimina triloba]
MAGFSPNCVLAVPKQLDPSPWMTPSAFLRLEARPIQTHIKQISIMPNRDGLKPISLSTPTGSFKASVPHDRQPQVASSNPNPSIVLLPSRSSGQAPLIDASQASSGRRSNSPKPNMLGNTSRSASSSIPFDLSHLSPDATRQQQLERKISVVRQTTNPPKIGRTRNSFNQT